MLSVNLVFLFVAGVAFLGFIINALFDKIKITNILPLMLIGLLIGPVLNLVNTGSASEIASFTPYVTDIAVAFILFEVGLNINIFNLKKVFSRATKFMFIVSVATAIVIGALVYLAFGWNIIESLIFGLAVCGSSSVVVPAITNVVKVPEDLKTSLLYESVATDSLQLILPLILLQILTSSNITAVSVVTLIIGVLLGSVIVGALLAFAWLYLLNRYREYVKQYNWILTIAMVLATYSISEQLNFNGAITIFVFGLLFSAIGSGMLMDNGAKRGKAPMGAARALIIGTLDRYFSLESIDYIKDYQREIVFFTSTFFFVYIGMLFNLADLSLLLVGIGVIGTIIIILLRIHFLPMLGDYLPKGKAEYKKAMDVAVFSGGARGLASAIVATLPITFGLVISGFLDQIFIIILFTNIAATIGIFMAYRKP